MVSKSVILNDLDRRMAVILRYSTEFGRVEANYEKCLMVDPYCLQQKCSPKTLVFSSISVMAICSQQVCENAFVIDSHPLSKAIN